MEPEVKKPWFSKTVWMGLIVAGASIIPGGKDWIAANLELVGSCLGGIIILLRLVSKGKISIGE